MSLFPSFVSFVLLILSTFLSIFYFSFPSSFTDLFYSRSFIYHFILYGPLFFPSIYTSYANWNPSDLTVSVTRTRYITQIYQPLSLGFSTALEMKPLSTVQFTFSFSTLQIVSDYGHLKIKQDNFVDNFHWGLIHMLASAVPCTKMRSTLQHCSLAPRFLVRNLWLNFSYKLLKFNILTARVAKGAQKWLNVWVLRDSAVFHTLVGTSHNAFRFLERKLETKMRQHNYRS
jgi:hypothetical protein